VSVARKISIRAFRGSVVHSRSLGKLEVLNDALLTVGQIPSQCVPTIAVSNGFPTFARWIATARSWI
jgi:hypothetical protein